MATDTSLVFNILAKDKASKTFSKVKAAAAVAFAAAGVALFKFGRDSVAAFQESEQAQAKLQDAFARFPKLADTNIDKLNELNQALMKKTKFDDDATASGQAVLAQYKLTGSQITQLTPLLQDYAAKTGRDLPAAAEILGKAILGQGRALKDVGINFKDTKDAGLNFQQLMAGLSTQVGGFAEKEGQTASGQMEILKNRFGEFQETVGGKLVPVLMKFMRIIESTANFIERNKNVVIPLVIALGTFATIVYTIITVAKIATAVQWAWNIAMMANPIGLIILAIIALIAVIVLIATKTRFFQGVWGAVWGFLKMIGAWFAGPFKNFFVNAFNFITGLVVGYYKFVISTFMKIVNFVTSLPGRITNAARGMWNGIVSAFKGAINWLIGLWNRIDFGINIRVPDWIPGIGGRGFSIPDLLPDLPMLAKGGIVTKPTLAVLGERGPERVTPLGRESDQVEIRFSGNLDSAFASAFQKLVRSGHIKIIRSAVV